MSVSALFWSDTQLRREQLPDGSRVVLTPVPTTHVAAFDDALATALGDPLDSEPLAALLRPDIRLTIVCSDLTRPCPALAAPEPRQRIVEAVLELAAAAGIDDVEIVVGRGLHRRLRDTELVQLLGSRVVSSFRPIDALHQHDAVDPAVLTDTGAGTFNRRVAESDVVVVVDVNVGDRRDQQLGALVGDVAAARHAAAARPAGPTLFHISATLAPGRPSGPLDDVRGDDVAARLSRTVANVLRPALTAVPGTSLARRLAPPTRVLAVHAGSGPAVVAAGAETLAPLAVAAGEPADVLTLGIPHTIGVGTAGRPDPLAALAGGLGAAFTAGAAALVRPGGVVIVTHPLAARFDSSHHPATIDFFERVLGTGRPAGELTTDDLVAAEERFAADDWYRHLYRSAAAYHATTPFALWEHLAPVRRYAAVLAVGADGEIARQLGVVPTPTLGDALGLAADIVGAPPTITHLTDVTTLIADGS